MSCWSARSFVSPIAKAVEDQGLDGFSFLFVSDELPKIGVWRNKKKKRIGIAQDMRAAKCFGDVPSIAAPNILGRKQEHSYKRV